MMNNKLREFCLEKVDFWEKKAQECGDNEQEAKRFAEAQVERMKKILKRIENHD